MTLRQIGNLYTLDGQSWFRVSPDIKRGGIEDWVYRLRKSTDGTRGAAQANADIPRPWSNKPKEVPREASKQS